MTQRNITDIDILDGNPLASLYNKKHCINESSSKINIHIFVCPKYTSIKLTLNDSELTKKNTLHLILKLVPSDGITNYLIPMFKPHNTEKEKIHLIFKKSGSNFICKIGDLPLGCYNLLTESGELISLDNSVIFFCIVFNPWSKKDATFINNDTLYNYGNSNADQMWKTVDADARSEYVINDIAYYCSQDPCKCTGPIAEQYYSEWKLGIGDPLLLLFSLSMISGLKADERTSVTKVCRVICALTNQNDDDNGLIYGNWSNNYENGKSPEYWTDTVSILRDYIKNENSTYGVEYGQCWVFALVLCSLLRCIGIPSRCVINFDSGHDTENDGVCDINKDSYWNFHYWVESWMKRKDLGKLYPNYVSSGWQVIDSTPQENSRDSAHYNCDICSSKLRSVLGPCPVIAVKDRAHVPYDTKFVCGEVNFKGFEIDSSCPHTVVRCKDKYYNYKVKCNYIYESIQIGSSQ